MAEQGDYRTDGEYIHYYLEKLSPNFLRFCLLLEGVGPPERAPGEPYRYLELGFGQGLSLNIHAAANAGEYWGVDFLPGHAETAGKMAAAAGSDCVILNKSFAQVDAMAAEGKLPRFDAVVLHGVWSWVNAENRRHLLNIIDRVVKPGGLVYVSYNSLPGWGYFAPARELMTTLMDRHDAKTPVEERVRDVLDFLQAFTQTGEADYFNRNSLSVGNLEHLRGEPPGYVAGEFLNASWDSFSFREVALALAGPGCDFVNTVYLTRRTEAAVRPAAVAMINRVVDPNIRESMRDFAMDTRFRGDVFVRAPRRLSFAEHAALLADGKIQIAKKREAISLSLNMGSYTIGLLPQLFNPLFDNLAKDGPTPKTVREVFGDAAFSTEENLAATVESLRFLIGGLFARVVAPDYGPETAARCRRLNRELYRMALDDGASGVRFIASPALGAGVFATDFDMLLLRSRPDSGGIGREEWVDATTLAAVRYKRGMSYGEARKLVEEKIDDAERQGRFYGLID